MSNEETKNITTDQKKKSIFYFLKIFGVLIIAIVIGCFGYYHVRKISSDQLEQKIQQTQANLSEIENTARTQQKTLQTVLDELNQLKQSMETLSENKQQLKDRLHVEEIRYLVKLANFNLQFQHNVPQAINLLKLADQEIRDDSNASLMEMRKTLAEDIADLQTISVVDVTGIYMRLLALNEKVDQLPLINKPTSMTEQVQTTVSPNDSSWWQKGLHRTWETLRQLVVVRYHDNGKIPFVTPEQQNYLYQNWHAMILHAMSALMQGQEDIYRASLQQVEQWVKQYGLANSPMTNAFLTELAQLKTIDIKPEIPKLLRSSTAVDALEKD